MIPTAGVKPRFAVGGWTDSRWVSFINIETKYTFGQSNTISSIVFGGFRYFSDLVLTQENRNKYAQSLKTFGIKYGFEGIDIDWECKHVHKHYFRVENGPTY